MAGSRQSQDCPGETHHEDTACRPVLLLGLLLPVAALADPLPTTPPESVGLSSERLRRITETLKADIAKGAIPGAVLLISRHGKIAYFEAMGSLDPEKKTPMTKDAIFRIYSMTKPITTVAAMMLFEEGKLALADPVAKYIPAFKDVKVGEEKPGADGKPTLELVAPQAADDGAGPDAPQLRAHLRLLRRGRGQEGLSSRPSSATAIPTTPSSPTAWPSCRSSTSPGTTWDYSQSTDVLGRVVEVVTGKPLCQALKEMLLDPLGMTDTSFYVTDPAKQAAHRRAVRQRPRDRRRRQCQRSARGHASTSPAAAAWSAPRRTTRASCRCWPTAARSTASAT